MAQPLTESDIIFPHLSNTPNFSSTLSSLKRSALSITNRLSSISKDSDFISRVAASYDLPLVANERCGSWYIPLDQKAASVYFKSTDGHMGEWAFSLRRLNLQLLDVVGQYGGCMIVDSTRRGKSMPDALSKTVPFWCCVINRAVFGAEMRGHEALRLFTPPAAVSESENAQMERRIDGFVQQFLDICKPDIPSLRSKLQKPLRPLWVTQLSTLPSAVPEFPAFHPIVLCTASRRVRGAEASEGGYIQGAADDHEAWSQGLTPTLFWRHKDALLRTNEEDLPTEISRLVKQDHDGGGGGEAVPTLIKPTTTLFISATSQNMDFTSFETVISCTPAPLPHAALKEAGVREYLHLPCATGKLGSRDLRTQLSALQQLILSSSFPSSTTSLHIAAATATATAPKTLIVCPSGKDLAVGAAVAYLCLFANDAGAVDLRTARAARDVDKTLIKQRLSWVTTTNPALNPSRATLQSVNAVLMSERAGDAVPGAKKGEWGVRDPAAWSAEWTLLSSTPRPPVEEMAAASLHADSGTPNSRVGVDTNTDADADVDAGAGTDPATTATTTTPDPNTTPPPQHNPQQTLFSHLALPCTWTFTRRLDSALTSHPSGTVRGTATFTPHSALRDTLVYRESGTFRTDAGVEFVVRRGYVYCLRGDVALTEGGEGGKGKKDPYIAVHFLDETSSSTSTTPNPPGNLFVEMDILAHNPQTGTYEASNRATHLCGDDLYAASWVFSPEMVGVGRGDERGVVGDEGEDEAKESGEDGPVEKEKNEETQWWQVRYEVQGPRKGYVSVTRYERSTGDRGEE